MSVLKVKRLSVPHDSLPRVGHLAKLNKQERRALARGGWTRRNMPKDNLLCITPSIRQIGIGRDMVDFGEMEAVSERQMKALLDHLLFGQFHRYNKAWW